MKKNNEGFLNKKRFEAWEKNKVCDLRGLSPKKALKIEEGLLSSFFIWKWRKHFFTDKPVNLEISLKHKRI